MYVNKLTLFKIKLFRKLSNLVMRRQLYPEPEGVIVSEDFISTSEGKTRILKYKNKNLDRSITPLFINLHGGGFVLLKADVDGAFCRRVSDEVGCTVVNIDYKLAPEHPFPAAVNEVYAIVKYFFDNAEKLNIDKNNIAIGGHSAGGNLATVICLKAKETQEFKLCLQVLDYPPLDIAKDPDLKTKYPKGSTKGIRIVSPKMERMYNKCYVLPNEAKNPLVSPIYAKDLHDLPPALVITANKDRLAEEGEIYAKMLKNAGVPVTFKMFTGVGHGFTIEKSERTDEAWSLIINELKITFS